MIAFKQNKKSFISPCILTQQKENGKNNFNASGLPLFFRFSDTVRYEWNTIWIRNKLKWKEKKQNEMKWNGKKISMCFKAFDNRCFCSTVIILATSTLLMWNFTTHRCGWSRFGKKTWKRSPYDNKGGKIARPALPFSENDRTQMLAHYECVSSFYGLFVRTIIHAQTHCEVNNELFYENIYLKVF